jgi:hypothetical protein
MTKGRATAIAIVSGILGLGIGVLGSLWLMSRFLNYGTLTAAEAHLVIGAKLLENIRASELTPAARTLETWLDGDLLTIGDYSERGISPRAATLQAISRIRDSRQTSGYVPADPSLRADVERVLALGTHE